MGSLQARFGCINLAAQPCGPRHSDHQTHREGTLSGPPGPVTRGPTADHGSGSKSLSTDSGTAMGSNEYAADGKNPPPRPQHEPIFGCCSNTDPIHLPEEAKNETMTIKFGLIFRKKMIASGRFADSWRCIGPHTHLMDAARAAANTS